jgi:hypothetical protein
MPKLNARPKSAARDTGITHFTTHAQHEQKQIHDRQTSHAQDHDRTVTGLFHATEAIPPFDK